MTSAEIASKDRTAQTRQGVAVQAAKAKGVEIGALIEAASWVVSLFGTDDPIGKAELREEIYKLRIALSNFRADPAS